MIVDPLVAFAALVFGLVVGSFLNVCIHRLPAGESIVRPASRCPHCGARVRFYDNIPLLSYLWLGGRCRDCRRPISWHYPVVEAVSGLISLGLFMRYGLSLHYLLFFLYAASLVVISFIDLRHQIIPDLISLPGIGVGLASALLLHHVRWVDALIGMVAGGGTLFVVAWVYLRVTSREGMGGGDIKLLAMIGAWMGWGPLPLIVLIASFSGAVIGLMSLWLSGKGLRVRIPFGPFLSLGALAYLFFGPEITAWYVGLLRP